MARQESGLLVVEQGLEHVAWATRKSWASVLVSPHGSGSVTVHGKAFKLPECLPCKRGIYDDSSCSHCIKSVMNVEVVSEPV